MKVPTNPFPGKHASFKKGSMGERMRHKAQKQLEALNYTPQTSRCLSEILRNLADEPAGRREAVLRAFSKISSPLYGR